MLVCCCVLCCVAVCCSAVMCWCAAVCCAVLQCVAVRYVAPTEWVKRGVLVCCSVLCCIAACCTHSDTVFLANLSFFQSISSPNRMAERKTEEAKLPKNTKNSRNEKFSTTATENVCLKDAYTVNLKKKSLILIYILTELYTISHHMQFHLIAPIAPAPFYSNHVI